MNGEWIDAYQCGIFSEFMEQRAPGHTVLDGKIYRKGMLGFKQEIEGHLDRLDFYNDPEAYRKKEELQAMMTNPDVIIIDVRLSGDAADSGSRIKGAVQEDPGKVDSWMNKYPKDKTLVFYCS